MTSLPISAPAEQPPSDAERDARRRELLAAVIADDDREARINPGFKPWEAE